MAKEECAEPWNKAGSSSAVRNRKTCPTSEKTVRDLSKDIDARPHQGDARSNGTSAGVAPTGDTTHHEPPSRVLLLMLLVGLSFSTRLLKISEPPHVW